MFKQLQQVGKAFMLPIAILPAAGLLLGIGGALSNPTTVATYPVLNNRVLQAIFTVMSSAGEVVFANLALLLCVGLCIGLAKRDKGTAALAGVTGYFVMTATIKALVKLYMAEGASIDTGVVGAIVVGSVAVYLHNRYSNIQLPQFLGFFGGSRFVPIVTSFASIVVGGIFFALNLMGDAVEPLKSVTAFKDYLATLGDRPIMGVIIGSGLTMLIQSSAATIGILQSLYSGGLLDLQGALPILFGDNIGTTITAVLAALGSNIAAKRVAGAHVLFNVIGTVLCLVLLVPFTALIQWFKSILGLTPEMTIAFAHGTFNIANTIVQFPFIGLLAYLVVTFFYKYSTIHEGRSNHPATILLLVGDG